MSVSKVLIAIASISVAVVVTPEVVFEYKRRNRMKKSRAEHKARMTEIMNGTASLDEPRERFAENKSFPNIVQAMVDIEFRSLIAHYDD